MTKVVIDPRCKFNYSSYYIWGVFEVFGSRNVIFDISPFLIFQYDFRLYEQGVFMILKHENIRKNIYIDFNDSDFVIEKVYDWCDVYAKININKHVNLEEKTKLLPIGPSFSIHPGYLSEISKKNILKLIMGYKYARIPFKKYISDHIYPYVKRLKYPSYCDSSPVDNYIFSMSTLWYDQMTDSTTNRYRARFIKESRKFCRFEGGFFFISNKAIVREYPPYERYRDDYGDCLFFKRISSLQYVEKTKKSTIVFNTPSVCGCHGWKLAEYLCMGKAIISTPLNNHMPGQFEPGRHYYVVEEESEIERAIRLLLNNRDYRERLEKSAKKYFETYLSPQAVIMHILGNFLK